MNDDKIENCGNCKSKVNKCGVNVCLVGNNKIESLSHRCYVHSYGDYYCDQGKLRNENWLDS